MNLLSPTAAKALSSPIETTIRSLLIEYGFDDGDQLLLSLARLHETFTFYGLTCSPDMGISDLDHLRVLANSAPSSAELALATIAEGETSGVEFKASMLFDWDKYKREPHLDQKDYRLDTLVHSVLKTIAAFANTDGGHLFVGVSDDGAICGLREDFRLTNPKRGDYDGWELFLRAQVESRFIDGKSVNAYVRTEPLSCEGRPFVKIQVASRGELTFLRKPPTTLCELYIRSGTRSVPIQFEDIQKHYELRRKF